MQTLLEGAHYSEHGIGNHEHPNWIYTFFTRSWVGSLILIFPSRSFLTNSCSVPTQRLLEYSRFFLYSFLFLFYKATMSEEIKYWKVTPPPPTAKTYCTYLLETFDKWIYQTWYLWNGRPIHQILFRLTIQREEEWKIEFIQWKSGIWNI